MSYVLAVLVVSLYGLTFRIFLQGRKIMIALDDLTAAANRLVTDVKALAEKLTNTPADDSAALESIASGLNAAADAADAALNPPAAPPATEPPASA